MVNWQAVGSGVIMIIIGFLFFFSSFLFVDDNNSFTIGGFGLFVGGITGVVIGIIFAVAGFSK